MTRLLIALAILTAAPAFGQERAEGDRYLIVTAKQELADAVSALAAHRAKADGFRVQSLVVAAGTPATAIRAQILAALPRYLLLVGDVDGIPAFEVAKVATDRPYGDFDGDGFPEAAVGRFSSSDPVVVAGMAQRTIRYETERRGELWRKRCALIAGEARFSPMIDGVIEALFSQIVRKNIDGAYDVDLTYANPRSKYCYPPKGFADRVVERANEGALVLAYVGHGQVRSVDDLQIKTGTTTKRYDVLGTDHIPGLRTQEAPPVFLAIACWTGRYEGEVPCIGEELMASPGGPVAFFGSSRISHPIQNGLLAHELVGELLSAQGVIRLGPALDRARKAMVKGRGTQDPVRLQILMMARTFVQEAEILREMPRHVDMYNLLGDPALSLARPEGRIALNVVERVRAGEMLSVQGTVPVSGTSAVTVSLETERDKSARPVGDADESPLERYARANDRTVCAVHVPVGPNGQFLAILPVPDEALAGRYVVKAFAGGAETCAVGFAPCALDADAAKAPQPEPKARPGFHK